VRQADAANRDPHVIVIPPDGGCRRPFITVTALLLLAGRPRRYGPRADV